MKNLTFFLPTRKGSQRVKNKNTRPFANFSGGLLENKLNQLIQTKRFDEIILSTNDDESIRIADGFLAKDTRLKIIRRPDELCLDTTNLQDLIAYVPTITDAQHILWGHVTTPTAGAAEYDKAIDIYFSKRQEGFDSLISVLKLQNFLLDKNGRVINNNTTIQWPRTQDLEILYEINHVIFIAGRETYVRQRNRIGETPFLYEMDRLKSFDIDQEEDFMIAEKIVINTPPCSS